jgi:hypothetical protein
LVIGILFIGHGTQKISILGNGNDRRIVMGIRKINKGEKDDDKKN